MSKSLYLERYAWKIPLFPDYHPSKDLTTIIVIPAFKEKNLVTALQAINSCDKPNGNVLILVLVNESEEASSEVSKINELCIESLSEYDSSFELIYSYQKLPSKKAGVGLARKMGMDEAVRIFKKVNKDGTIVCYDSDCLCEENYLVEIEKHFSEEESKAGIVFYEHQLDGSNQEQIIKYESYLRYYTCALRYAKFPYAYQTLGSCIVVRSSMYQSQGGMNTRQAGEDFYFLNKVIPHGGFVEINTTTAFPSDRVSDRVPFGTGKAVDQMIHSSSPYHVYNPQTFEDLRVIFSAIDILWENGKVEIPESLSSFLDSKFEYEVDKVRDQTSSLQAFRKRFSSWFDAFKILKFVHFARDNFYPNVGLDEALKWLDKKIDARICADDPRVQLQNLRAYDRRGSNQVK